MIRRSSDDKPPPNLEGASGEVMTDGDAAAVHDCCDSLRWPLSSRTEEVVAIGAAAVVVVPVETVRTVTLTMLTMSVQLTVLIRASHTTHNNQRPVKGGPPTDLYLVQLKVL